MATIKIAHLYYDLMNLYGENGNLRALEKALIDQQQEVVITKLSLKDQIDFLAYDIFYLGSGSEDNIRIVNNDLLNYQAKIKKAIEKDKFFIITGNALDLFGQKIKSLNQKELVTLGIFPYDSQEVEDRIVGEQVYTTDLIKEKVIGFQNRQTIMSSYSPLFEVIRGTGSNPHQTVEGIKYKNFYGTYLIGPLLIRNPALLKKIIKNLFKIKKISYQSLPDDIANQAYQEYLKNFVN